MKSTKDWIDAVKAAKGLTSDYQLAAHWNVTRQLISKYRTGTEYLSEEMAAKVAADLGIELGFVLACAAGERARIPSARAAWLQLAKQIGSVAAVVLVAILATEHLFQTSPIIELAALPLVGITERLCIMLNWLAVILFLSINLLPFIPNKKN